MEGGAASFWFSVTSPPAAWSFRGRVGCINIHCGVLRWPTLLQSVSRVVSAVLACS